MILYKVIGGHSRRRMPKKEKLSSVARETLQVNVDTLTPVEAMQAGFGTLTREKEQDGFETLIRGGKRGEELNNANETLLLNETKSTVKEKLHAVHFVCYSAVKRGLDFVFATVFLILLAPLFVVVAIAIKLDSNGPVFFRQTRTGRYGKEFRIIKFRSMVADNDVMDTSCDDQYTRVGKFIRKTSIDELPQFINVFLGQMSFVGPRPWVTEYYSNMNEMERRRCLVRPGITGLAAAKGRNGLSIFEKIELDLEYVEKFSFVMDVKVVFLTMKQIFISEEVDAGKAGINNEIELLKNR